MHAIAEEEAQSRENAQVYVHKEGSRKSRKSSKVSASGLSDPERQMLKEAGMIRLFLSICCISANGTC